MGYRMTQLVYVTAALGIADELRDNPKTVDELASLVNANPEYLCRLLRSLVSIGLFDQTESGKYALNPLSELLCRGTEGSLWNFAVRHGAAWTWLPWGELLQSVKTGKPAFDHALGLSHWEYLANHPDVREVFSSSMAESTAQVSDALLHQYKFPQEGVIMDIGGGYGVLLANILTAYPTATGVLYEQADVVQKAGKTLIQKGLMERCKIISGSFFEKVPPHGDIYILQRILHDWEDAKALQILKNCRKAMRESGKLLIIERIMPDTPVPSPVKIVDITVMVLYGGGRERTEAEFKALLAEANIRMSRIIPLPTSSSMIEAAGYCLIEGIPT